MYATQRVVSQIKISLSASPDQLWPAWGYVAVRTPAEAVLRNKNPNITREQLDEPYARQTSPIPPPDLKLEENRFGSQ